MIFLRRNLSSQSANVNTDVCFMALQGFKVRTPLDLEAGTATSEIQHCPNYSLSFFSVFSVFVHFYDFISKVITDISLWCWLNKRL